MIMVASISGASITDDRLPKGVFWHSARYRRRLPCAVVFETIVSCSATYVERSVKKRTCRSKIIFYAQIDGIRHNSCAVCGYT